MAFPTPRTMAMSDAAMAKLADVLAARGEATMRQAIKENNSVLISSINEATDEKITSAVAGLREEMVNAMKELKAEIK